MVDDRSLKPPGSAAAAKPGRRSWILRAVLLCAIVCGAAYLAYSVVRPRNETVYYELMEWESRPHVFGPEIDPSVLETYAYAYVKVDYGPGGEVLTVTKFLSDGSIQFILTYEYLSWGEIRETRHWFEREEAGHQRETITEGTLNGWTWWVPWWIP